MLLYHFPLTSSSATPNLTNKGLRQDYTINSNGFVAGGMISSYCLQGNVVDGHIHINNLNGGSICCRVKGDIVCTYALQGELMVTDDDKWHSYVLCDGKAYQDGAYLQDISAITMFDNCIDASGSLIQDIRIYDYALSQAEINEYSRALVVHYPLQGNKLNPSVLKDVSGLGNDLEGLPNSYKYEEKANGNARGDKMLQLSTKAFSATYTTQLKGNPKARSISFWWKASQQATGVSSLKGLQLFILKSSEITAWLIYNGLYSTANILNLLDIGGVYNVSSVVWHHFVYVIDQATDTIKFYYDTVLRGTVQISSLSTNRQNVFRGDCVLNAMFSPFNWGTTPDNPASNFSDIRVYATALSAEDIKNLYKSPISVSKQHQTMAFEFVEGNDGFSAKKNGIVQHNELRENDSEVNGCYNDKLITNELIEN